MIMGLSPMTFLNSEVTTEAKRFKVNVTQNKSEKMTDDWMKGSINVTPPPPACFVRGIVSIRSSDIRTPLAQISSSVVIP